MRHHNTIIENVSIDDFFLSCTSKIFCLVKFLFVIK